MQQEIRKRIKEAQKWTTMLIKGKPLPRIKLGSESIKVTYINNHCSCGVKVGQYHVLGCSQSQCPECKKYELTCICEAYDEE